jgi:hypothetical protein
MFDGVSGPVRAVNGGIFNGFPTLFNPKTPCQRGGASIFEQNQTPRHMGIEMDSQPR